MASDFSVTRQFSQREQLVFWGEWFGCRAHQQRTWPDVGEAVARLAPVPRPLEDAAVPALSAGDYREPRLEVERIFKKIFNILFSPNSWYVYNNPQVVNNNIAMYKFLTLYTLVVFEPTIFCSKWETRITTYIGANTTPIVHANTF
jgi:hypothetical protein